MSERAVELDGVSKVYAGPAASAWPSFGRRRPADGFPVVSAVKDLSLSLERGEFAALAGPSGSGKSTLLNLIGTLDAPSSGRVRVLGRDVGVLDEDEQADFRLRRLGFVFQSFNLLPVLTAFENVEYPLRLQGVAGPERSRRAAEALAAVGLKDYAERRPDHLSGGQQQRVAVARAIVHRPELVLADEPTANLDSRTGAALLDLFEELHGRGGLTVLFSSHDPAVLARAHRVLRMHDGALAPGDGA